MCGGAALAIAARDDHASTSALIGDVQKSPQGAVAGEPLGKAKGALARAADARAAGEFARAEMLEALAQEWAETARDLVRVAEVERQASELEKEALDLQTSRVRAQALLEETVARRARAEQALRSFQQDGGAPAVDAGTQTGGER